MEKFIIGLEITKLSHKIVRALEAEIINSVDKNMSATTARIICYVVENSRQQPVFQKDIEAFMGLNRSSVSLILKTMEKNELVNRQSIEGDGRYKKIIPTEKAMDYHVKISEAFDKVEDKMKVRISDLEEFKNILTIISDNLEGQDGTE